MPLNGFVCLVSQVYKVEQIKNPLENYRDIDIFKIYVSGLGLLSEKKDLTANDILYMVEEINDFKGGSFLPEVCPLNLHLPSAKPVAIGGMSQTGLDAELMKGIDSLKSGKTYTTDEVTSHLPS